MKTPYDLWEEGWFARGLQARLQQQDLQHAITKENPYPAFENLVPETAIIVNEVLVSHTGTADEFCGGCDWKPSRWEREYLGEQILIQMHQAQMIAEAVHTHIDAKVDTQQYEWAVKNTELGSVYAKTSEEHARSSIRGFGGMKHDWVVVRREMHSGGSWEEVQ